MLPSHSYSHRPISIRLLASYSQALACCQRLGELIQLGHNTTQLLLPSSESNALQAVQQHFPALILHTKSNDETIAASAAFLDPSASLLHANFFTLGSPTPCVAVSNDGCIRPIQKTPSKKRARCWENHFNPTLTHITCSTLPFPDIAPITPHEDFYIHQLLEFCHSLSNKPSRTQLQTPTKVFAPETACVADCVADSRLDKHSETWTLRGNRGRVWPISWHLVNSTNYQQDSISVLVTVSYISIIPLNHQATNLQ